MHSLPVLHFTPPKNWMNDPNGLVFYNGEYHLFYQHFPHGLKWGAMHWGHAVSKDLIKWEHLPIALFPDKLGTIFSGSVVVDKKNTSGFGTADETALVAVYTHFKWGLQRQGIACSIDCGRSWKPYRFNPVIKNPFRIHFRDPKVFYHEESSSWVMSLAAGNCIQFYSSPDLKNWKYESSFGKLDGAHGSVWECPDLFPLEVDGNSEKIRWVLLVSVKQKAPNGGSGTQYFTGSFDGKNFVNDNAPYNVFWLDYGKDNYAGVTWSDVPESDGRRLFIAWMSNWQYALKTPAGSYRGQMTLPRELSLSKSDGLIYLKQKIVREVNSYFKTIIYQNENLFIKSENYTLTEAAGSGAYVLTMKIKNDNNCLNVVFKNNKGEFIKITCDMKDKTFFIDRRSSGSTGFSPKFPGVHAAPFIRDESGTIEFEIYFDYTSVELIACGGFVSASDLVFPSEPYTQLVLFASENQVIVEKITFRGTGDESAFV